MKFERLRTRHSKRLRKQRLLHLVALVDISSYAFEKFGMGFQNYSNRMPNKVVSVIDVVMELWCKLNNKTPCVNFGIP